MSVVVCRFSTFFRAHQENQTIGFFGAASAISSLEIIEVSIAGKHFFVSKQVLKSCCVENIIC